MPDTRSPELRSRLSVSLRPEASRRADRRLVLAVFSFRDDAHLVPGLIENIGPMVDGWVSYDDRAGDDPFGDEGLRRKALLDAAVEQGAGWVLAVDPAERIESALAGRIRDLIRADGLVAYEFRLRAMFSAAEYRVDGGWARLGARRLFGIRPGFLYDRAAFCGHRPGFADHWYPTGSPYRIIKEDLNIYDFRSAIPARRWLQRDRCMHRDPYVERRPFAYEDVVQEAGMLLQPIPADRPYGPPFREDGGTWSAAPPDRQSLMARSRERFDRSVDRLFNDPHSPLFARALPGHQRGVDRLNRRDFCRVLDETVTRFVAAHGYPPDLFQPERYAEKLVWRKFFSNLRVPQSGNKLLVASYIPPQFERHVRVPTVVWRSSGSRLPENGEIAPGWYYLKSNHGSGFVRRIRYPLEAAERAGLERTAARWLQGSYRPQFFEWWYDAFPHEIFLEHSVGDEPSSIAWGFYTFPSGVAFISVDRKTAAGVRTVRLSGAATMLPERYQHPVHERLSDWAVAFDPELLGRIATAIATPLGFARVDFLVAPDGTPFLSEITLVPASANAYLHPEVDMMLGRLWTRLV